MCSNYRPITDVQLLHQHFGVTFSTPPVCPPETWPLYQAPAIRRADTLEHTREAFIGQFGLLPHWVRDTTLARRTYNARSETAHEKPSFRDAWRKGQRCIVPTDWVYEPNWETGKAVRWKIASADGSPLGIAGLWSTWRAPNGVEVLSFTMLTINADNHGLMRRFHKPEDEKRMVAILDESDYDAWLDCPVNRMMQMLLPWDADKLAAEATPLPSRTRSQGSNPAGL